MVRRTWARQPDTGRTTASRSDSRRGQAAIEYVGVLTLLLVISLAVVQLGIAVYAAQQAGTAARAGARVASDKYQVGRARSVARDSLSDWLAGKAGISASPGVNQVTVTVKVPIPSLLPMFKFGSVTKKATMPRD
ncbi:TadE family protein [Streptomyces sp. NPDC050529]|uniref:TadE family protein n=1 Tax=unclassified Streptomyces TaxID=2593676 RepID=UPI002DDAA7D0|nr:TadE family protein [Streptomyces sp. NBC_01022]WRZ84080.1 pilus assembly protein [Streptomyces sp. NBC_01022]